MSEREHYRRRDKRLTDDLDKLGEYCGDNKDLFNALI